MRKKHILNVKQGIWIDERWLREAQLGARLQVEMSEGEIRIRRASQPIVDTIVSEKGWELFRTLGDDAPLGCLKNAARDHDSYLYGK